MFLTRASPCRPPAAIQIPRVAPECPRPCERAQPGTLHLEYNAGCVEIGCLQPAALAQQITTPSVPIEVMSGRTTGCGSRGFRWPGRSGKLLFMASKQLLESQRKGGQAGGRGPIANRPFRSDVHPILQLQPILGNQRIVQLIRSGQLSMDGHFQRPDVPSSAMAHTLQPSGDRTTAAHPATGPRAEETVTARLQRAASESSRPIEEPIRSSLEQDLGHDFRQVRVHSGAASAAAAESIGARAYTLGNDIHLGAETRGMGGHEYHRLMAHEAIHTVQQGGRTVAPHAGLPMSSPTDTAEREAQHIASSVTVPGANRSPSVSLAMRDRMRAGSTEHTITRCVLPHLQRDLSGKKSVTDGDFDLDLKTEAHAGHSSGMSGTIKFTPGAAAPDDAHIRLLQTVRTENLGTGKDYEWTGAEANRNKTRTTGDAAKGVQEGWFVDHSAAAATPRTAKGDSAVSPYYRDYWPNSSHSQDGSKSGKTINPASLWDFPSSPINMRFSFETAAKGADTGHIYATLTWGFTVSDASKGKIETEHAAANAGPSATFTAAVKSFDEHYKNPGASTAPK